MRRAMEAAWDQILLQMAIISRRSSHDVVLQRWVPKGSILGRALELRFALPVRVRRGPASRHATLLDADDQSQALLILVRDERLLRLLLSVCFVFSSQQPRAPNTVRPPLDWHSSCVAEYRTLPYTRRPHH